MADAIAYLAIEGSAATAAEAIRLCERELVACGCVNEGFAQGCIDREKDYPTGICVEIPVALPHCMAPDIKQSALCYLRLDEPVRFMRMDDDQEYVMTRHIFNLAIDRGDHLTFLSRVMGVLQDIEALRALETIDIGDAPAFFKDRIESEEH